jgi:hypothetical protein
MVAICTPVLSLTGLPAPSSLGLAARDRPSDARIARVNWSALLFSMPS